MDGENDSPRTSADSLRSDETPAPIRYTRLWIGLVTVIVASFAVLGYYGGEVYRLAPPVPGRVVTSDGDVLFTGQDIKDGQNVWQSMGGQEVGTVWGHGAYVAPDWSADWLHREATWLLDHWARAEHGKSFASLTDEDQAALKARLKTEIRGQHVRPEDGRPGGLPAAGPGDPVRRRALRLAIRRRSGGRQAARRLRDPGERDPRPATDAATQRFLLLGLLGVCDWPCRPIPSRRDEDTPMNADPTRIVMTETRCRNCGIPIVQVYHRDFAVMRGEGRSAEEAAGYLVNRLESRHR